MKIFKRKNKEIKVVKKENPIDYIKKEKNKHFFITTSFHVVSILFRRGGLVLPLSLCPSSLLDRFCT